MNAPATEPARARTAPRLARPDSSPPESAPRAAAPFRALVAALDGLLDRVYGSRWNPAHQSGSLAIALMLVVSLTGIYLLLYYRIGAPYESMARIQAQVWGGRWLRALHRYASDLAVVFIALHALRMFAEGRSWGPRVLAWVTGLLLTFATWVVGWTGYILVWDAHAQLLGAAGARLMDALGLLATPIGRIFGGGTTAPASFFFLNLFVHMALPLAMTLLVWVHTLRLARGRWLPEHRLTLVVTAALTVLSWRVPAALGPAADGLMLGDRAVYDVFYTAWIPLASRLSAGGAWAATLALVLVPVSAVAWWRPRRERRGEPSHHNPLACTGCGQCVVDCPFEAIIMVPAPAGHRATELASVKSDRCVSCGLCAGSCDQLAIGPRSRDGHAQMHAVHHLEPAHDPQATGLVHCAHDRVGEALERTLRARGVAVRRLTIDCIGALHTLAVQHLLRGHRGVFVLGCPPHRCRSREGVALAVGRLFEGREPVLRQPLELHRVRIASGGTADLAALAHEFERFHRGEDTAAPRANRLIGARPSRAQTAAAVVVSALLLAGVAALSQVQAGAAPANGALRLAWRLPGQSWRACRPLTAAEIARQPAHMRTTEECRTVYLHYQLEVHVDGRRVLTQRVAPRGARGDRPLYVEQDVAIAPGRHDVTVSFVPRDDPRHMGRTLTLAQAVEFPAGRARLVGYDADRGTLVVR